MPSVAGAAFAGGAAAALFVLGASAIRGKAVTPVATVLATGDEWGEVEPCGCHLNPRGGLARLATTVASERANGLTLLIDAGDALYPRLTNLTLEDSGRAHLILEAMSAFGYDAVGVGERDLARGVDELKKAAAELHVPFLAANLIDSTGSHPFPASRIVSTPIGKVGIFAITDLEQSVLPGLHCEDPRAAAVAAIADLHRQGAVLVVGIFHMTGSAAQELAKGLEGVDALIVSHQGLGRVLNAMPPLYALPSRGRELDKLTLDLGSGPIQDPLGLVDYKDRAAVLDNSVRVMEHRLQRATSDEMRRSGEEQLEELKRRRDQAVKDAQRPVEGRQAHDTLIVLGKNVADDPTWAKRVADEVGRDGRTPGH